MAGNWRKDGIRGFDKVIRVKGKLYKLSTTRCASSYAGMAKVRRDAQKYAGKEGKVYKVDNTYCYAIYLPYSGAERPKKR